MRVEPAEFHPCPICRSLMSDFYCVTCKSVTILPWREYVWDGLEVIGPGEGATR